ncbi:putative FBD-associated F-box protein At3g50710 [Magnolia sinica]|uniref:putative FBD-associated F-box protein At3g50710 n=1 Tax=Magnolia sinica TaxID=86752 RepID=UPI002659F198|nr:putative FBD-associated F-box protein At3g50710 [Magnolia sinica]
MLMEENSPPNEPTAPENEDRISNLSKGIRTHIVSFLQMEDAVMTMLCFEKLEARLVVCHHSRLQLRPFLKTETQEQFVHFVDKALSLHNGLNIEKLCLSFGLCGRYMPRVNAWIVFAVGHKVQELDLDFPVGEVSKLPCWLFTYESLLVLKLNSSLLKLPPTVTLNRLVTLHLAKVEISDDLFIEGLFTGCPVLENLKFEQCGMDNLKILTI